MGAGSRSCPSAASRATTAATCTAGRLDEQVYVYEAGRGKVRMLCRATRTAHAPRASLTRARRQEETEEGIGLLVDRPRACAALAVGHHPRGGRTVSKHEARYASRVIDDSGRCSS